MPSFQEGFSLVELSIVLVILGLLTGGILGGQSLIKAAELRSVVKEYNQWQTASNTFRTRYFYLPGDMPNAESFWGTAATCPPAANTVVVNTCNGNGDGEVGNHQEAAEIYEQFMFWQHLEKAGLITGTYTGSVGPNSTYHAIIGTNVPSSKFKGGGWTARYRDNVPVAEPFWFAGDYGNAFVFGAQGDTITIGALLTPQETWSIDTKLDDGKPGKGKVVARFWNNACATAGSNTDYDAAYNLQEDSAQCSLSMRNDF